MSNPNISQRERSQYNPLNLGHFSQTSVRYITSVLGMRSQIIQGGIGNNTYNNWFQVSLDQPAWIILIKAGTVLNTSTTTVQNLYQGIDKRMEVAVYAQDYSPIQQRYIAQIVDPPGYTGRVAGAQSDLYNTFDPKRFDRGNELVYELLPGRYLICVSATSNEEFRYGLGMVIQFPQNDENFILLEDTSLSYLIQENEVNVPGQAPFIEIASPITFDITLDTTSAYTVGNAEIVSGIFVQVNNKNQSTNQKLVWQIGPDISGMVSDQLNNRVLLDVTESWAQSQLPDLSLSEWEAAWKRDHSMDDAFPEVIFAPFATSP